MILKQPVIWGGSTWGPCGRWSRGYVLVPRLPHRQTCHCLLSAGDLEWGVREGSRPISPKAPLPGVWTAALSPCPHPVFLPYLCVS